MVVYICYMVVWSMYVIWQTSLAIMCNHSRNNRVSRLWKVEWMTLLLTTTYLRSIPGERHWAKISYQGWRRVNLNYLPVRQHRKRNVAGKRLQSNNIAYYIINIIPNDELSREVLRSTSCWIEKKSTFIVLLTLWL